MTIEIETVFKAAQDLKEEGTDPSVRNVQAKLGCRGNSYIAPLTGLWNRRELYLELADELPEAYLEDARLLAFSLWSTAKDRANILENIHLREIERLHEEIAELKSIRTCEKGEFKKCIEKAHDEVCGLNEEVRELTEQLSAVQAEASEAEAATIEARQQRDKAEAKFNKYSGIVQSGSVLDKAQLDGALAWVAQLEFEIEGMRKRVKDADARRAEEAARFDRLLEGYVNQSDKALAGEALATEPHEDR